MITHKNHLTFCGINCILLGLFASSLIADTREDWEKMRKITPLNYVATQAAGKIKIDGKLDELSLIHI